METDAKQKLANAFNVLYLALDGGTSWTDQATRDMLADYAAAVREDEREQAVARVEWLDGNYWQTPAQEFHGTDGDKWVKADDVVEAIRNA